MTADIIVAPAAYIEELIAKGSNIAAAHTADDCIERHMRGPVIASVETALAAVQSILAPRVVECE